MSKQEEPLTSQVPAEAVLRSNRLQICLPGLLIEPLLKLVGLSIQDQRVFYAPINVTH